MTRLRKLVVTALGMTGLRLDEARWNATYVVWVIVFAATVFAYGQVFVWGGLEHSRLRPWAVGYAAVIWLVYYGGLSLVLGSRIRRWAIERWGEDNAVRGFNAMLGIVFLHQALAQGAVIDCWANSPGWLLRAGAIALILFGFGIKLWATYASSLDIYYYNDMFTGRAVTTDGEAFNKGPFRWFKNPMYGVGNLQGYGSALLVASWPGLAVAGIYHASLYAFYFAFERPFVARRYAPQS